MRHRYCLLTLTISLLLLQKSHPQCGNTTVETINANSVKAFVLNAGDFFTQAQNANAGFIVPYQPLGFQPSTIFSAALWMGAYDGSNNLKTACPMYRGGLDFEDWSGPLDDATGEPIAGGCDNFDKIWKVLRSDVLFLINDFDDNGTINLPVAASLRAWPARGNPHFEAVMGFALPDQDLAPFFDRNGNGLYEPLNGEYPVIDPAFPQVVPDELLWCVFNDKQDQHQNSGGEPLGVEVHFLTYAFHDTGNEILNHCVFTRHKIINKSGGELQQFRAGLWVDSDLGCEEDDFLGCDTTLNTLYFYNVDNTDGNSGTTCTSGVDTYGENPPVQTITFLNQALTSLTYIIRAGSGTGATNPNMTDPDGAQQFYYYLSSRWKDGLALSPEGDGYDPGAVNTTNFAFFDNPNDPSGWSLNAIIAQTDPGYDRRGVMSAGPFSLIPGEIFILAAAHAYHREPGANHLENIDVALGAIPQLQNVFDSDFSTGLTQLSFCENACVWPGDTNHDGIVKSDDLLAVAIGLGDFANDNPRVPASKNWFPQAAADWNDLFSNGLNYKHGDCNGDGHIDEADLIIVHENYLLQTPVYQAPPPAPTGEGGISITFDKEEVSQNGTAIQRRIVGDISLGDENHPFVNLYGFSFTVKYDTAHLKHFLNLGGSIEDNTFLGEESEWLVIKKSHFDKGEFEVAISRKDGSSLSGFGKVASIQLELKEEATTPNPDATLPLTVTFADAKAVFNAFEIMPLTAIADTVLGTNVTIDSTTAVSEKNSPAAAMEIVPNPNNGEFLLFPEGFSGGLSIELYNLQGESVFQKVGDSSLNPVSLKLSKGIVQGIYFLKVMDDRGKLAVRKLVLND